MPVTELTFIINCDQFLSAICFLVSPMEDENNYPMNSISFAYLFWIDYKFEHSFWDAAVV